MHKGFQQEGGGGGRLLGDEAVYVCSSQMTQPILPDVLCFWTAVHYYGGLVIWESPLNAGPTDCGWDRTHKVLFILFNTQRERALAACHRSAFRV